MPIPLTIAKKEFSDYFKSPKAYIILIITISVFNVFFFMILDQNREASLRDMFKLMEFLFVFIIPILTMSIFAEEKREGTLEFLLTCPIKPGEIMIGKYLGIIFFLSILIGLTGSYDVILEILGHPDRGAILAGYLGLFLESALFAAIGLLTSSWTKNQIVAAICSYVIILSLYFSVTFMKFAQGTMHDLIRYVSVWSHTENFSAGLIQASDMIYFLSGIIFCLFITRFSLDQRP